MIAILRTHSRDGASDSLVEIADTHVFSDGPYTDTVPFAVGSNQEILEFEIPKITSPKLVHFASLKNFCSADDRKKMFDLFYVQVDSPYCIRRALESEDDAMAFSCMKSDWFCCNCRY